MATAAHVTAEISRQCERIAHRARTLRIADFRWSVDGDRVVLEGDAHFPEAIDSAGKIFATSSARSIDNRIRHAPLDPLNPGSMRSPGGYVAIENLAPNGSRLAETIVFEVKPGDTLESIALTVFGDAGQAEQIRLANRNQVGPSGFIHAGLKLRIPLR